MIPQSRDPDLPFVLLTRPADAAARFAGQLRARFGAGLRILTSPLIAPRLLTPALPDRPVAGLIFTSETGVAGFARMSADPALQGVRRAYCVGDRTAMAAHAAGLDAVSAQGDATTLLALIRDAGAPLPLLHLRGADSRGEVAMHLNTLGITTHEAVVYDQQPQPLTPEATTLLTGSDPVILPLFSPRTAALFRAAALALPRLAPLQIAALSPAVAAAVGPLPAALCRTALTPDADAVIAVIAAFHPDRPRA